MLKNLVENAVRYTSAGQVLVRVDPFASQGSDATPASRALPMPDLPPVATPDSLSTLGDVRFVALDTGPG